MTLTNLSKSNTFRGRVSQIVLLIVVGIFAIPFIFPLLWLISTAFKSSTQIYISPPVWIPNPIRWQNFPEAWNVAPFGRFLVNTMITTFVPMLGEVFVSAMVAFSFARVRWPGRDKIFGLCLATMILPGIIT